MCEHELYEMGVCDCHGRWKSYIFIGSILTCRQMVGIDNKLMDQVEAMQVWIVLTGYWEAVGQQSTPGPISSSLLSYALCAHSMGCPRKGDES